jgi:uncharacterized protein YigA (DUF484 family)
MSEPQRTRTLREAEQAIVRYLRAHPDFFNRHPELVETLRIPHLCHPAVSLLEHQVTLLRERNAQLRSKLEELVEVARDNGQLISHLQRLTLVLIEARALPDMLQGIETVLREEFKAEFTALRLTARVLQTELDRTVLLSPAMQALFEPLLSSGRPLCGRLTRQRTQALFGEAASQVASIALVPLQGNDWQGLLAVGSQDEGRFHPGMGTLFLRCMGELISHALQAHLPTLELIPATYSPLLEGSD